MIGKENNSFLILKVCRSFISHNCLNLLKIETRYKKRTEISNSDQGCNSSFLNIYSTKLFILEYL